MPSLFDSTTWTGEFFHPDIFEARFSGSLAYSPEDGVILTYRKADDGNVPDTTVLHGILDTGEMCSLFGDFSLSRAGFTIRNELHTSNGKCGFKLLVVGAFVREDFALDDIYFTVSGLQDFLVHEGWKNSIRFEQEAIHTTPLSFGSLELRTYGNFDFLPDDISAAIYSTDDAARSDLIATFAELRQRHPNTTFMLKSGNIEYKFRLRLSSPTECVVAYRRINDICNLFALLRDSPTHPEEIEALLPDDQVGGRAATLYPSLVLNPATVELARRPKSHVLLPLNAGNLSLPDILAAWFNSEFRESILVSAMQHEIGYRTEHSAHGDIVLYASQLESISHAAKRSRDKYEYAINTYGSPKLLALLERIFDVRGVRAVGEAISDLRNEIAHVGRPRKLLSSLDLGGLIDIAICLKLVLSAFVLRNIGIQEHLTGRYVDALLPRLRR